MTENIRDDGADDFGDRDGLRDSYRDRHDPDDGGREVRAGVRTSTSAATAPSDSSEPAVGTGAASGGTGSGGASRAVPGLAGSGPVTPTDNSGSAIGRGAGVGAAVRQVRDLLASAVLTVAVLAAVVLATGAVLTALGANPENAITSTVRGLGGTLDGPFADLFTFAGEPGKQLLVNWGIAALAYLIVGRVLERVLRP